MRRDPASDSSKPAIAGLKLVQADKTLAEKHYAVTKANLFDSLLQFLTAGPTVALCLKAAKPVAVARGMMGMGVTDGR